MTSDIQLAMSSVLLGAGAYLATVGTVTARLCRSGAIYDIVDDADEQELARTAKLMAVTGLVLTGGGLAAAFGRYVSS